MKTQTKDSFFSVVILIATILSGLSAGLALSHVLEIPGKHSLTAMEFLDVQHHFYGGYAIFGAIAWLYCSLAGLIAGFVFYKNNKPLEVNTFIAAGGFIICLFIFFFFLNHYNQLIAGWTTSVPSEWQTIRNHWEISHSLVFVISTISFIAFINSYQIIKTTQKVFK